MIINHMMIYNASQHYNNLQKNRWIDFHMRHVAWNSAYLVEASSGMNANKKKQETSVFEYLSMGGDCEDWLSRDGEVHEVSEMDSNSHPTFFHVNPCKSM